MHLCQGGFLAFHITMVDHAPTMEERRSARSTKPEEALTLLLDAARQRLGVRALTVATSRGKLVAGSGDKLEEVMALGAKVDRGSRLPRSAKTPVATWRLRVRGEELIITSLGRAMEAGLGEGVRRILSAG